MPTKVEFEYRRYRGVTDNVSGQQAEVSADVMGNLEDVFTQKVL